MGPKTKALLLAGALVVGAGLAACGSDDDAAEGATTQSPDGSSAAGQSDTSDGGADAGEPQVGGSVTFSGQGQAPATLDPISSPSSTGNPNQNGPGNYFMPIFGVLTYEDWSTGEVVAQMAKSVTMTDSTHWVVKLRKGVEFSDGTPFDAEAVKYTWDTMANTETAPQRSAVQKWIKTLKVVDPLTLEVTLNEPNTQFDRTIAREFPFIVSPTAYEKNAAGFGAKPVGAGPFVVQSYDQSLNLKLKRNPTYWDAPRPYLDELTILNRTADDVQRYNTFASGDAQIMNRLMPSTYPQAESGGYEIISASESANTGIAYVFNTAQEPFDDRNARIALATAIDRELFNETIYGPVGRAQDSLVIESSPYYTPDAKFPDYDPARAQELFDAYADEHGKEMTITFTIPSVSVARSVADFVQTQLASYDNVKVDIQVVEGPVYVKALIDGDFDLAYFGLANYDPLADYAAFFGSDGNRNFGKYSNPEIDRLIKDAYAAENEADQVAAVKELQEVVADEGLLWVPAGLENMIVTTDEVGDVPYMLDGIILWDRVWVKQ